jgi:endogenous inhibitor of DNA gyrase (YacG/DUF329 family)
MIELICPKCGKTFERQGKKRGKMPYCSPCKGGSSSEDSSESGKS